MDDRKTRAPGARMNRIAGGDDAKRRARFARDIARSVFGRNYWDEDKEAEKRAAAKPRPRPSRERR